jgi:hypothetical protein
MTKIYCYEKNFTEKVSSNIYTFSDLKIARLALRLLRWKDTNNPADERK